MATRRLAYFNPSYYCGNHITAPNTPKIDILEKVQSYNVQFCGLFYSKRNPDFYQVFPLVLVTNLVSMISKNCHSMAAFDGCEATDLISLPRIFSDLNYVSIF